MMCMQNRGNINSVNGNKANIDKVAGGITAVIDVSNMEKVTDVETTRLILNSVAGNKTNIDA